MARTKKRSLSQYTLVFPTPWETEQARMVHSRKKRIASLWGRRGGKTVGASVRHAVRFLEGKRILYASHTSDQLGRYWSTLMRIFKMPIEDGVLYCNNSEKILEVPGTEIRIKAKSAWDADTLRGDYADELALDEFQLMHESTWQEVGLPMLLDTNGDALFTFTPPSIASIGKSKARDPMHAMRMFRKALNDPRWEAIHATSMDNPHLSKEALTDLTKDMSKLAYRQEILAEDIEEAPGAMFHKIHIEQNRALTGPEQYDMIVTAIDPSATSGGDEAGIVTAGRRGSDFYIIEDASMQGSPAAWAAEGVDQLHKHKAHNIVAESNQGGEMVREVIRHVDPNVTIHLVHASKGKVTRADPISALYENGLVHHIGQFPKLEAEMCFWQPGNPSPNRMDALVWALEELRTKGASLKARARAGRR